MEKKNKWEKRKALRDRATTKKKESHCTRETMESSKCITASKMHIHIPNG